MCSLSFIVRWISGLRKGAASLHTRPRITGVIDFYSPVLDDEVGETIGLVRLRGERDRDYRHRLGIHISEKLNELDALLKRVLDHRC